MCKKDFSIAWGGEAGIKSHVSSALNAKLAKEHSDCDPEGCTTVCTWRRCAQKNEIAKNEHIFLHVTYFEIPTLADLGSEKTRRKS